MQLKRRSLLAGTCAWVAPPMLGLAGSAQASRVLRLGLVPSEFPRAMVTESEAMVDTLSKALGTPVEPYVAPTYNGVIEALRSKSLEVARLGPFSYIMGAAAAPIEAFAVAETRKTGQAFYRSLIVARKDSGIKTLADLRGRTFAFVDPASASGHLFAKAGLVKAGLHPDRNFRRVIFSGSHDSNATAVQNKDIDAAAIGDRLLDAAISKGLAKREDLVILWKSVPIPEAPMVWHKDLDAGLKKRVRAAFLDMRDIFLPGQGMVNRFLPITDSAYDVVRETARTLNLDLKNMK
jgi:phosphonate transport system substrate-binding protein